MQIKINSAFDYEIGLADGAENQFPQTKIYEEDGTLVTTLNLVHAADGNYNASYTYTGSDERLKARTIVYSDSYGGTENEDYDRANENIDVVNYAVAGDEMDLISDFDAAKTAAQAGAEMTLTSDYDAAKTAAQAGADGDTLETLSDQLDAIDSVLDNFTDAGSIVSSSSISSSNVLTLTRGDRISQAITGISDAILSATKVWVTFKNSRSEADSAAILQIEKTGGLLYLNGEAVTESPTDKAGITLADNGDGTATATFTLEAAQCAELPERACLWDIQYMTATDTDTPKQGTCTIEGDVTRATA